MRIVDLVSTDTREGRVLKVLLDKLETIRRELRSDKVFDVIGRLFENRSLRGHMREALTDEGERRARRRLEAGLTSEVVRKTHRLDEQRYGRRGDVARRLGTLKHEMERERYLHLLPANVRRFVELASPLLGLAVRGELDGSFSLVPTRPGALDPLLAALETHPADARGRLRVRRPESGEVCVWMHPGEPVFDAMCDRVLAICGPEAARGAIFVDPRATEAYLMHLGDVAVEEEGRRAEDGGLLAKGGERYAEDAERKTLKRRLLALRQGEDGKVPEMSVEEVGLLRGVPDHPPGAVPLAARALTLRAEALG
ncbi:MAG: hypothetical protein OXG18_03225, partial [Gemmatimonadetes bacterium]|nr:hypothetical protein [Gemmatimonadota bacterium]